MLEELSLNVVIAEAEPEPELEEQEMGKACVVFEHEFDEEFIAELNAVREARIVISQRMLKNLQQTQEQLMSNAAFKEGKGPTENEIAAQLRANIEELRLRTLRMDGAIFADELSYYIDLIQRNSFRNLSERKQPSGS